MGRHPGRGGRGPGLFQAYNPQAAKLSTGGRLLTSLTVLGLYWRLLFIPWRPTLERFVEPAEGAAPLVMLVLAVVALVFAFRIGRRRPLVALGLAWLVLAPIPTLNLIPLNFLFAERYLYLPAVGVALLVAALLTWLPERVRSARTVSVVGLGALLLFFVPLTIVRNTEWRNVDTLLRATVRDNACRLGWCSSTQATCAIRGRSRRASPRPSARCGFSPIHRCVVSGRARLCGSGEEGRGA